MDQTTGNESGFFNWTQPNHRFLHNSAIVGEDMLVWGGANDHGAYFSHKVVWGLNLAKNSWSKRIAKFELLDDLPRPARASGIALVGNQQIYQFGGVHASAPFASSSWQWLNDLHVLDGIEFNWKRIASKGLIPDERSGCGMCVLGDHFAMMGGYGKHKCKADLWLFSLVEGQWSPVECEGKTPSSRCGHSFTAIDGNQGVLIGGRNIFGCLNDSFLFNMNVKEWVEISSAVGPHKLTPRSFHSTICVSGLGPKTHLFVLWGERKDALVPKAELIEFPTMKCTEINLPEISLTSQQTVCSVLLINGKTIFSRFGGRSDKGNHSDILQWDPHLHLFSRVSFLDSRIAIEGEKSPVQRYIERHEFEFDESDFVSGGGYGEVYRGRMKESGETVAVKILVKRRRSPDESDLLKKEAAILYGIKSYPTIVKLIGICNSLRCYALLMEFVSGGDLATLLASSNEDVDNWANRIDICNQVASGMAHLHGNSPPVIHLDLKPKNVLIENASQLSSMPFVCKICDFGLAKMANVSTVTQERFDGSTPAGTVAYIAPERYHAYGPGSKEEKRVIAKKSDVFSYGVLLWEIRERGSPFEGMPKDAIGIHIRSGESLPEGISQAPDGYSQLTTDCSAFDANTRPSFTDIVERLQKIQV